MSHALLLRLFLSPYFSISVAMHYLKTYPESIGISHYLCSRMKSMPAEEVEFYWPQICHLIITRPSDSNALESFVLARAEESTHSAMLTFWFMQAALTDLTPTRSTNPRPFLICQRVLHKCHEIIFGDPPEPSRSPYRSLPHSPPVSTSNIPKSLNKLLSSTSNSVQAMISSPRTDQRINPHIPPAMVGMGVMIAGVGMPGLVDLAGQWAVTQGRRPRSDAGENRARVEVEKGGGADLPGSERLGNSYPASQGKISEDSEVSDDEEGIDSPEKRRTVPRVMRSTSDKSVNKNGPSTAPALGNFNHQHHHPSQTAPTLATPPQSSSPQFGLGSNSKSYPTSLSPRSSQKGADPFSQMPSSPPPQDDSHLVSSSSPKRQLHQPFYSVPEFSSASTSDDSRGGRRLRPTNQPPPAETLLATYSLDAQRQLLRSHYCRSEVRFLLLLEDISNRLLVVPKPARVSALRAELTSLNHNLPAEVCMPLWCAADHSHEEGGQTSAGTTLPNRPDRPQTARPKAHARVVRISPGDSVVLNSAERAPFLLHVEILEGDLDFDPTRRENRELLKKIVVAEDLRRRKREQGGYPAFSSKNGISVSGLRAGFEGFGAPIPDMIPDPSKPISHSSTSESRRSNANPSMTTASHSRHATLTETLSPSLRRTIRPEDLEEMDLVEQVYGSKLSVKDSLPDLTDSIPLPTTAPRNKQLDLAAWDRDRTGPNTEVGALSRRSSYTLGGGGSPDSPDLSATNALSPGTAGLDIPLGSPALKSTPSTPGMPSTPEGVQVEFNLYHPSNPPPRRIITLEDYSERMRTAAVMLAQLNASLVPVVPDHPAPSHGTASGALSWIPGTGWIRGSSTPAASNSPAIPSTSTMGEQSMPHASSSTGGKLKLAAAQAAAIRERIMEEMIALEEERVERMTERPEGFEIRTESESGPRDDGKRAEDEGIVRRELNKADPSAAVFRESWTAKKSRIRASSPWGHLANWDVISVIVKTGADLRQEQLATQLIERFCRIWKEEKCECWARFFRILITGESSGLVETITDAVSVHSIKKGEYARRIAEGGPIGQVSLMDHYVSTYGKPDSGRFARAQRNFIKSLAGYSVISYLLQIKDRHNGNILVDRDGHLIHIDFGFMLSNSPGNMGFEAAPFKMPMDYVEILGGLDSPGWVYFKKLFKEGFECARKHSDSLITIVELMQKDSKLDCFAMFGEQTAHHFRDRFALGLTTSAVDAYLERLILTSTGSNYTRLYDTFQYYSQGVL